MKETDSIDQLILAECERRMIPGLSLAIIQDGIVTKLQGYGFANLEHQVPATPDTIYNAGSIAKQFVATAIMQLTVDGLLALDEPIGTYLGISPEQWQSITIRHLLTHTSGIPHEFGPDVLDERVDYSDDEVIAVVATLPLQFAPGDEWRYSNLGYLLLGLLTGRMTGQFYSDFLHERIFTPLGMETARVKSEADIIPHRAAGYILTDDGLINVPYVPQAARSLRCSASGTLLFTVKDLIAWDVGLASGTVLDSKNLAQMWSPVRLNRGQIYPYGFGWDCEPMRGHRLVEHGGQGVGTSAHIARYLDDRLTIILLANRNGVNLNWVAHTIAGLVDARFVPAKPESIALGEDLLEAYVGRYDMSVTIRRDGNRLIAHSSMLGGDFEMIPVTETRFFVAEAEIHFEFANDDQGQVTHFAIVEGDGAIFHRVR